LKNNNIWAEIDIRKVMANQLKALQSEEEIYSHKRKKGARLCFDSPKIAMNSCLHATEEIVVSETMGFWFLSEGTVTNGHVTSAASLSSPSTCQKSPAGTETVAASPAPMPPGV
jgi:hypothetical protein